MLDRLQNGLSTGIGDIKTIASENPIGTAVVIGSTIAAGGVIAGLVIAKSKKRNKKSNSKSSRKKHRRIKHTRRGWMQDRRRRSKQKWELAYQRRKKHKKTIHHKSKSKKGTHYTKNGQPYIILSSGKAKFIKRRK